MTISYNVNSFVILPSLLLLSATVLTSAQFAIPARYDGFSYNGPKTTRPVVMEAFLDLLCPSCANGWPVVKHVAEFYGDQLQLIVHPFPVPFHHYANFAARGMHIMNKLNASLTYAWMEAVYDNQPEFGASPLSTESPESVTRRFADLAGKVGTSPEAFFDGYSDLETDLLTRTSFKYGCHRGVVATPTFLVNGVTVLSADESWRFEAWRELLDPLLGPNNGIQDSFSVDGIKDSAGGIRDSFSVDGIKESIGGIRDSGRGNVA